MPDVFSEGSPWVEVEPEEEAVAEEAGSEDDEEADVEEDEEVGAGEVEELGILDEDATDEGREEEVGAEEGFSELEPLPTLR